MKKQGYRGAAMKEKTTAGSKVTGMGRRRYENQDEKT